MQSTGQASTQAVSLVPIQGSAITYAMKSPGACQRQKGKFQYTLPAEANPLRRCTTSWSGIKPDRAALTFGQDSQRVAGLAAEAETGRFYGIRSGCGYAALWQDGCLPPPPLSRHTLTFISRTRFTGLTTGGCNRNSWA